jgi:hypothetical protein
MRGPIDFIIVGFQGPKFDGSILKALMGALDKGVIGLVALSIIHKDAKGNVSEMSVADTGDGFATEMIESHPPQLTKADQEDIEEAGGLLENDSAAALLIVEHLWAIPLKEAITKAKGVLLADGRIHPEALAGLS